MRKRARAAWMAVTISFRADPWRSVVAFLLFGLGPTIGLLSSLWLKYLTDAVVRHDGSASLMWVLVLGFTSALTMGVTWAGITVLIPLMEATGLYIDRRLVELTTSITTIEHHERPEHADQLELLRLQRGSFGGSPAAVVQLASMALQLVVSAVLLARLDTRLLLLPIFGIPSPSTRAPSLIKVSRAAMMSGTS